MFEKVGERIKGLSILTFLVQTVASFVIGGIIIKTIPLAGFFVILGGIWFSYVSTLLLYGFGELVENSSVLSYNKTANKNENEIESCFNCGCSDDSLLVCTVNDGTNCTDQVLCDSCRAEFLNKGFTVRTK